MAHEPVHCGPSCMHDCEDPKREDTIMQALRTQEPDAEHPERAWYAAAPREHSWRETGASTQSHLYHNEATGAESAML